MPCRSPNRGRKIWPAFLSSSKSSGCSGFRSTSSPFFRCCRTTRRDLGFNSYPPNPNPIEFHRRRRCGPGRDALLRFRFWRLSFSFARLVLLRGVLSRHRNQVDAGNRSGWRSSWPAPARCLTCSTSAAGSLIRHQANIDSPGGLLGGYIIHLTVPYALGSVGAGVLFATLFGISAIYLFNVNPVHHRAQRLLVLSRVEDPQRGGAARQGPAEGAARGAAAAHPASRSRS